METKTAKLCSLNYSNVKTYLIAALFIASNMALPQLSHLVPQGGVTWLPIYFFTLVDAYKLDWKVGLLAAILSLIASSLLFEIPPPAVPPAILPKSILLATAAGWAAHHFNRISLPILLAVILFCQIADALVEWAMADGFFQAIQNFHIGLPGMAMQVVGGCVLTRYSTSL